MYFVFCAADLWCHGEKKNLLILLLRADQILKAPPTPAQLLFKG